MPTSPTVNFNFQNNNVQETTPQLGVSFVYARTTKGPRNDASKVITSLTQFNRIYGEEVVPNGRISQIEKAFNMGSKLRICRILSDDCKLGFVYTGAKSTTPSTVSTDSKKIFVLSDADKTIAFGFNTKSYGETIDTGDSFKFKLVVSNHSIYAQVYKEDGTVLENLYLLSLNGTQTDGSGLTSYNDLSSYLNLTILSTTGTWDVKPTSLSKVKEWWEITTNPSVTINTPSYSPVSMDDPEVVMPIAASSPTDTDGQYILNGWTGTPGATPTLDNWKDAIETLLDYTDVYQVWASGINHNFSQADVLEFHKQVAKTIVPLQEYTYYIELPWWSTSTNPATNPDIYEQGIMDDSKLVTLGKSWVNQIGNSKYIAYFAGGSKFYNNEGNLENSEALGSIVGLGDTCATANGPWRSFAGMNRGIIFGSMGPVTPNYGSPSRYEALNLLANNYLNMVVVKDTPSSGKQPMLWHLFSSQFKQDSERFLSTVRLNLYLKKTLRPIAEKYIEEPNVWSSWKNMYLEIKPILDTLITKDAITEYTYMGDQNVSSWNELTVNTESEARQGKYKAIIKYKDVVAMQEITFNLVIDSASKSITLIEE